MKELMTVDQIKKVYSNTPYIQETTNLHDLVEFFCRKRSNKSRDIEFLLRVMDSEIVYNSNTFLKFRAPALSLRKDVGMDCSGFTTAAMLAEMINNDLPARINEHIMPKVEEELKHLELIIRSLAHAAQEES